MDTPRPSPGPKPIALAGSRTGGIHFIALNDNRAPTACRPPGCSWVSRIGSAKPPGNYSVAHTGRSMDPRITGPISHKIGVASQKLPAPANDNAPLRW